MSWLHEYRTAAKSAIIYLFKQAEKKETIKYFYYSDYYFRLARLVGLKLQTFHYLR